MNGGARLQIHREGTANAATRPPVLDHLLTLLASYGRFDLALEVPPDNADAEVAAAGAALGAALHDAVRATGAHSFGAASMIAAEALAHVVIEASDTPLLVSNVDLTEARVGG